MYSDRVDLELEEACQQLARQLILEMKIPIVELPDGENLRQPKNSHGLTHVHHFYTPRSLAVLAVIHEEVEKSRIEVRHVMRQAALSMHTRGSIRNRYIQEYEHRHVGVQSGTLYVPPVREEINLIDAFDRRLTAVANNLGETIPSHRPLSLASRAPRLSSKFLTIASITASPIRHSDPISTTQI